MTGHISSTSFFLAMGRRKLYASKEEAAEAHRQASNKYYRRHRKTVLRKAEGAQVSTTSKLSTPARPTKLMVLKTKLADTLTTLEGLTGGAHVEYCQSLVSTASQSSSKHACDSLTSALNCIEALEHDSNDIALKVLSLSGAYAFKDARRSVDTIAKIRGWVYELWETVFTDSNHPVALKDAVAGGALLFQKHVAG
ncbi:hypothetical protein CYLTODRAFT_412749 [Cylindrobasidium torrendii FP15055 ss-10]|uniref:Uncharacterized protein n=1 Tax=Cylindrobasidium torrendii FP15055 ss-10 TaxID=1314674 RepID=A0A0D7B446_9AGAR|nr:hypothetical protein CYLTODRAFT_412749 [Cylindrobasidium torrendii FP15055 ss-10]